MSRMPTRNLPPQAEPWGRAVDNQLATISRTNDKQAQDTGNALSAINGTLTRLGEQVSEIRTIADALVVQQATLEAQQEQLQTQQTTLSNQQAQLTQTVTELQTVVAGMIRPTSQQSTSGGFVITGSIAANDSISFTVPNGYTRAVVIAMSGVTAQNTSATSGFVYNQILVNGLSQGEAYTGIASGAYSMVSVQSSSYISVTPGSSLVVESWLRNSPAATWAGSNGGRLVAQVLFLR